MGVERAIRFGSRFGSALRERRLAAGISETGLATALGVRLSQVRAWERGDSVPDPQTIRALAGVLRLESTTTLDWLERTGVDLNPPPGGPEVAIVLVPGEAPADPFSETVVIDLTRSPHSPPPTRREAPRTSGRGTAAVFPEPDSGVFVYSEAAPGSHRETRLTGRQRWLVTVVALAALGFVLWWAFGELGSGLGGVFDRLDLASG